MRVGKGRFGFFQEERGFTLVEVLVAVAILAVIGVVFMNAMTTSFRSVGIQDEQITADSLARTQLEIIKAADYAPTYEVTVEVPFQYSIPPIESPYVLWDEENDEWVESVNDTKLQKITVRVSREGGKAVLMVEALKIKR